MTEVKLATDRSDDVSAGVSMPDRKAAFKEEL